MSPSRDLPSGPPFTVRARLVSSLASGATLDVADGFVEVDAQGRITAVEDAAGVSDERLDAAVDLRPWVVMPGMVDLHAHLPQVPNAGLGFALPLLDWLDRLSFPTERSWADPLVAERLAPAIFRAFATAGTTTVVAYGVVYEAAMDAAFRAAEAHGIRAILGKVMMDRLTYDSTIEPTSILERTLRESADLAGRWHGADDGRLGYAVTPRFAISCTAELLRESATLARDLGCWWQTHVSEDVAEIAEVGRLFSAARDYVDVYDQAGGLGERTILAHAVHLSGREEARLAETGTRIAHCPISNLFLGAGVMPLASRLGAGIGVGLGSDVSGGAELSLFGVMRTGAYAQQARRALAGEAVGLAAGSRDAAPPAAPPLGPLDWLRLATLDGARALGLDRAIGSIEVGKEADIIAIDPGRTAPLGADLDTDGAVDDVDLLVGRLIFRAHPDMVRAAWVRGRRLEGTS
ncbi:MAG TPA: amidohydrolase family protein [Candidatus Limnocylindrales bacterium]|nr:amidohydrolase family protein [Candidatus Limnocylindrales bacterium]